MNTKIDQAVNRFGVGKVGNFLNNHTSADRKTLIDDPDIPSGTIEITENGVYDVTAFAEADVQTPVPSGKITITQNGDDIDVSDYALADIDVPEFQPSGTLNISENGTFNVYNYANVEVNVPTSANTQLTELISGNIQSINVPTGITNIRPFCFKNCESLTNIILPNGITDIGDEAFSFTGISSIAFPNSLTEIGSYAFVDCPELTEITINSNITVYAGVFQNGSLNSINYLNNGINGFANIDYEAFAGTNLSSIRISRECQVIGAGAFYGSQITDIYYEGTQAQWEQINIGANAIPQNCTIHYEYTPT